MKKYLMFLFIFVLSMFCLYGCDGTNPDDNVDYSKEAREIQKALEIKYQEGDGASSITKDINFSTVENSEVIIEWKSDNAAIAIEGLTGRVTRSEEDVQVKITVTLKYHDVTLSKPFNVVVKGSTTKVSVTSLSLSGEAQVEVGKQLTLSLTVEPSNATNKAVVWSSSNENVATVDDSGVVSAISSGNTVITVKSAENETITYSFNVEVLEETQEVAISQIAALATGIKVKTHGFIVGINGDGYLIYDESGYIFVKANVISCNLGENVEVIGTIKKGDEELYIELDSITKGDETKTYDFIGTTFTQDSFTEFLGNVQYGKLITVKATIKEVNDEYAYAQINDFEGTYGVKIAKSIGTNYELNRIYKINGFALAKTKVGEVDCLKLVEESAGVIYKISFNTLTDNINLDEIEYTKLSEVELPDISKDGYIFLGWTDNDNLVVELTEYKDYELKALWQERVYEQVAFELNDGKLSLQNQFAIRNYNSYSGVNKKYDCFTIYKKGSTAKAWVSQYYVKFFMKEVEEGSNIYKVSYKAASGTSIDSLLDGNTYPYDYIISSNATNPEHSLFTNLLKDPDVENYYFSFEVPENCPALCNISVVYGLDRNKININDFRLEAGDDLPLAVRDNYEFAGWYDNSEFTGEAATYHINGVKKYYAKWTTTVYNITYELNGGECNDNLVTSYTYESEEIILPTVVTKADCTFLGWYDNSEASGDKITKIAKNSTGDLTLYACFVENGEKAFALIANEVRIFNLITPTKVVNSKFTPSDYKFTGEGLDNKYADLVYDHTNIFTSLAACIAEASENDIIYIAEGQYNEAIEITKSGLYICGPNYLIDGKGERLGEAELTELVTISASNITLEGLKFTSNASIFIRDKQIQISDCYVNGKPKRMGSNNRQAIIVGSDESNLVIEDITIKNNYCKVNGASADYTKQLFAFNTIKNLYVLDNYFTNEATKQGTAGTGLTMLYSPSGEIIISRNEFRVYTEHAVIRSGYYSSNCTKFEISDNIIASNSENGACGQVYISSIGDNAVVDIIGNEFNSTVAYPLTFNSSSGTFNVKYNSFNISNEYYVNISKSSGYTGGDPTVVYENNYFGSGISSTDTTGAASSSQVADLAELKTKYEAYKNN